MTLATFMMLVVFLETLAIILMWWARSAWWKYRAGQSIMALLIGQTGILALGLISRFWNYDFPHRDLVYSGLYFILAIVMAVIGVTIFKAQQADRLKFPVTTSKEE